MKKTNVFGRYHQIYNALLVLGLIIVIIAISWFTGLPHVRADTKDNTITMIMNSRYDVTYYPLNVGKTIFWSNKDNVDHKIKITESTTGKLVSESDTIKPYSNFSHTFEKAGVYHFSDPPNSQMGRYCICVQRYYYKYRIQQHEKQCGYSINSRTNQANSRKRYEFPN
jgi:plastocyanin